MQLFNYQFYELFGMISNVLTFSWQKILLMLVSNLKLLELWNWKQQDRNQGVEIQYENLFRGTVEYILNS